MKEKYKLTISDWSNGIWGNRVLFYKTLIEAKEKAKKENGRLKLYDENGRLIHSQHNQHNSDSYA